MKGIPALEATMMLLWSVSAGVAPLFFIFGELISFADYPFEIPPVVRTAGVAFFVLAIWLLHRAHHDLGIAGPLALIAISAVLALRIPREERAMLEEFGDAYRLYMSRTGRILPKLSRQLPGRD